MLEHYAKANEESDFIHSATIHADECQRDDRVRIAWLPSRVCVLSYMGDYRWRVEESINSKLQVGNTFYCRTIAQGEELIVDHLETENGIYEGFRRGIKTGLPWWKNYDRHTNPSTVRGNTQVPAARFVRQTGQR